MIAIAKKRCGSVIERRIIKQRKNPGNQRKSKTGFGIGIYIID